MEFLRRDGWTCYSGTPATQQDFLKLAQSEDFELIGLSISADRHLQEARQLITDLKRRSQAKVLVGGRCILDRPELVNELGADAMARDGRETVRVVKDLLNGNGQVSTP